MKLALLHPPHPLVNSPKEEWNWVSRGRDYYNLWVSLEGSGILRIDGIPHEVSPGFAVLLLPEEEVAGLKPPGMPFVNLGLHVRVDEASDRSALESLNPRTARLRHLSMVRELAGYLEELAFDPAGPRTEESSRVAELLLNVYLADLERGPEDPVDARLRQLTEQFRLYPEREWRIPDVAREAGLSVSQLGRRFRRQFGLSPREFLLRQRVEKARMLLVESTLNVSQISDQLGYRDIGYFSRQFKQKTGLSPLELRRRSRGG